MTWTRRSVLQGGAALAWLAACAKSLPGPDGTEETGAVAGEDSLRRAFHVWRQILDAVRASPDHLAAERDRLVAAGDVDGIIAFVRDGLTTVPATRDAMGDADTLLWGVRGTLRTGAGSMRDKVEVLREALVAMGHDAVVMKGFPQVSEGIVARLLAPSVASPPRDIDVDEATVLGWLRTLGLPEVLPSAPYDPAGREAVDLAASWMGAFDEPPEAAPLRQTLPDGLPFVRATVGGVSRDINVLLRDLPVDDPGIRSAYDADTVAPDARVATFTLLASTLADGPEGPRAVASLTVPATDLLGRSVLGQFVPLEDLRSLVGKDLRALSMWLPTLRLAAPALATEAPQAVLAVGAPLVLSGERFVVEDGEVVSPDGPVSAREDLEAARDAVTQVTAVADARGFPEVVVRADALDGSGGTVRRLPGAVFTLSEDGVAVPFRLLTNDAPAPRVAFVIDQSGSVPATFLGTAGANMLEAAAEGVLAVWPDASFRVLRIGSDPTASAWRTSPADLAADFLVQSGVDSAIWTALADAASWRPTVIVALTDGEPTDAPEPELLARLALAPPVLFLDIAAGRGPAWEALTGALGAEVIAVTDAAAAEAEMIRFAAAQPLGGYAFVYEAPPVGAPTREVRLALADRPDVVATARYDVPSADRPAASRRLTGLALQVDWPDGTSHVRPLAGHVPALAETVEADALAVQQALLGGFELHVEGAAPTWAAWLDDVLTARLAWEPVLDAVTAASTVTEVEQAFFSHPPLWRLEAWLTAFGRPVSSTVSVVGLRATLATTALRWSDEGAVSRLRRLDVLPVGGWRSWADDPQQAFAEAAACGAFVAGLEGFLHAEATVHALAGVPLVQVSPYRYAGAYDAALDLGSVRPDLDADQLAAWGSVMVHYADRLRWVAAEGEVRSFWAFDVATGDVLGVLADGSGGGLSVEDACGLRTLLDQLERLGTLLGYTGALGSAAGVWYSLEITKAKKLLAAITVLEGGGYPAAVTDETDWSDLLSGVAESMAEAGVTELVGVLPAFGVGAAASMSAAIGVEVYNARAAALATLGLVGIDVEGGGDGGC